MKTCRLIRKPLGLLAGLLLFLVLSLFTPLAGADSLEVPGTGACEVLLQKVAAAFDAQHPGHRVTVPPSVGSSGGIRLVNNDQAILARVARPLKKEEKVQGLRYLVFARDMVVFAVGARVPVQGLTTAQLVDVYSGKITTWQELGDGPAPIRLLLREPGDSSLLVLQQHLPPLRNITFASSGKVIYHDPDMLKMLEKYHYSIGWLTFSSFKAAPPPIHPLAIDGIAPSLENAQSQKYKLIGDYALVFKENRLNELARSFLDFVFSQNCQTLMKQSGVMPVDKE